MNENEINVVRSLASNKDFRYLIELLDRDLWGRYPKTQGKYDVLNIIPDECEVVIAYEKEKAIGCACLRTIENDIDKIELKRMFVSNEYRSRGVGRKIISELEKIALEKGKKAIILSTGINQAEAVHLYEKCGYEKTELFGKYIGMDDSICMKKVIKN
jgi:putative acetyltransferase